jgi:hypothetical protein
MSFCPKCSYLLDIHKSKVVGSKVKAISSEKKTKVKSVSAGIKKVITEETNPSTIEPLFTKDQMIKNKNYNKLNIEQKNKMLNLFEQYGGNIGAMFLCNNCNWQSEIKSTIKLYNFNKNNNVKKILPEEFLLISHNPIYSRTKDYTCKNNVCKTHKNLSLKEAVFFKETNSIIVNYVCSSCLSSWTI